MDLAVFDSHHIGPEKALQSQIPEQKFQYKRVDRRQHNVTTVQSTDKLVISLINSGSNR